MSTDERFKYVCCQCGMCCLSETCPAGMTYYGTAEHEACPGLLKLGERFWCSLVPIYGKEQLGIGAGCCFKGRAFGKDGVPIDFPSLPVEVKVHLGLAAYSGRVTLLSSKTGKEHESWKEESWKERVA